MLSPNDQTNAVEGALSLPHAPIAAGVRDPTRVRSARLERPRVQDLTHGVGDRLARQQHQLVGVLAE